MSEARVYAFADFFGMKPGTILGGFAKVNDSWRLATSWYLPDGLSQRDVIPFTFITEHDANWRRKFRGVSQMFGTTRFYKPVIQEPKPVVNTLVSQISKPLSIKLTTNQPVGIYLGHILRSNEIHYVNVLLGEGYDVWIRCV